MNDLEAMLPSDRIRRLETIVARQEKTIGTLITWIVQSAASPISLKEAEELLKILHDYSN